MLIFIIANTILFAHVLTTEQIPQQLTALVVEMDLHAWQFLIIVNIILLIAGAFMEPSAIILILVPILSSRLRLNSVLIDSSWGHYGSEYGNRYDHTAGWA